MKFRKLRGRIIEKFGTYVAFAAAVNLSHGSIAKKLAGSVDISTDQIEHWARVLDIPPTEWHEYFFKKGGV